MPSLCLFGAQWGDEGKGKIIDALAAEMDFVVRYQGGANAGHTVVVGDQKYVLHLVPSGVLHPGKVNVIANGVAVDPLKLIEELDGLAARGIQVSASSLRLSARAHVIFEHHKNLDVMAERLRGTDKLGTTGRGIGPAYSDKAARAGMRIADLLDRPHLEARLRAALTEKNALRERLYGEAPLDPAEQFQRYCAIAERLAPYVGDTGEELRQAYRDGKQILFEAAQGAMLDVDHGTYPYVTSSNTGVDGIPAGVGFPARWLDQALGIAKAYCTRVGEGPFPSEDHGPGGVRLREQGNEYGATTGRPRRCGWLDTVALRYALDLNGADGWILTNLDVLSGFEKIRVCVGYRLGGRTIQRYPAELANLDGIEPVYVERPGWSADITRAKSFGDLPAVTREYVEWIEAQVGYPIRMISVGPARDQLLPRGA